MVVSPFRYNDTKSKAYTLKYLSNKHINQTTRWVRFAKGKLEESFDTLY